MAAARDINAFAEVESALSPDEAVEVATRHLVQPWPFAGQIGNEARGLIEGGDGIYITDGHVRPGDDAPVQYALVHDEHAVRGACQAHR